MKKLSQYIPPTASYFILFGLSLVLFQSLWRVLFYFFTREAATEIPGFVLIDAFLIGIRFDLALTGYLMLPLILLGMLPFFGITKTRIMLNLHIVLSSIGTAIIFFVHLTDIEFFKAFNTRLNGTAFLWAESPGYMIKMVWQTYPVVRYLLLWLIVLGLFLALVRLYRNKILRSSSVHSTGLHLLWMVILVGGSVLAARGRVTFKAPLRWGVAYFSDYHFANQLAMNPAYSFFRDVGFDAIDRNRVNELLLAIDNQESDEITRKLLEREFPESYNPISRMKKTVRFDSSLSSPPNVILIIMESFGSTRIGSLDNRLIMSLSPGFDSLAAYGYLFRNIYSTGVHTYTGIFSTLYGHPPGFGKQIMRQAHGHNWFMGLPQILSANGYATSFYTTHDPHFDNMQGFLMANGVEKIISEEDYPDDSTLSSTGVPDHVMFDEALARLKLVKDRPFFATLLTGSNHGPWIIPDVPSPKVPDSETEKIEFNAFLYSDWSLARFIRSIESSNEFDNTLIVVTSDNGNRYKPTLDLDLTELRIPLLFYGIGEELRLIGSSDHLGSQLDIVATIMGRVRLDYDNYTFGHDLFDSLSVTTPFAHMSERELIGYLENDFYLISRLGGDQALYHLSRLSDNLVDSLPDLAREYRVKAEAIYQSAYQNMKEKID